MRDSIMDYIKENYAKMTQEALTNHLAHSVTEMVSKQSYDLEMRLRTEMRNMLNSRV